jgi:hypothetical protein
LVAIEEEQQISITGRRYNPLQGRAALAARAGPALPNARKVSMSLVRSPRMTDKKLVAIRQNQRLSHGPVTVEDRERIRATHCHATPRRGMRDSNCRQVARLTSLLMRMKRHERHVEALDNSAGCHDVLETKGVNSGVCAIQTLRP